MDTKRSRRVYVYWGIALALLVVTAVLCWTVVVPVMNARRELERFTKGRDAWSTDSERLDSRRSLVRGLCMYYRLPKCVAPDKRSALEMLGRIGSRDAVDTLTAALKDEDTPVRYMAVVALGRIKDERCVEPLAAMLGDTSPHVQFLAAEILVQYGDARAIPALVEAVKVRMSGTDKVTAAEGLAVLHDKGGQEALEELLNDNVNGPYIHQAAAIALEKIRATVGDQNSTVPKGPSDVLRFCAKNGFQLHGQWGRGDGPIDESVLEALRLSRVYAATTKAGHGQRCMLVCVFGGGIHNVGACGDESTVLNLFGRLKLSATSEESAIRLTKLASQLTTDNAMRRDCRWSFAVEKTRPYFVSGTCRAPRGSSIDWVLWFKADFDQAGKLVSFSQHGQK